MSSVGAVIVSYNSAATLRRCVDSAFAAGAAHVVVVDNASTDDCLATIRESRATVLPQRRNGGFAAGCNVGWRAAGEPYTLLLNPDATIDATSLARLATRLDADPRIGAVAPRIRNPDGSCAFSLRRFPRIRSTFGQALAAHRLFPHAAWSDELIRDPAYYESPQEPDWVSGACILVRRSVLELLDGLDEGFFLYCEDIDLCRRIWDAGYRVAYVPDAAAVHVGGVSSPRGALLPVLAASRIRYAAKHRSGGALAAERIGIALESGARMLLSGDSAARAGEAAAFVVALRPSQPPPPERALRRVPLPTASTHGARRLQR